MAQAKGIASIFGMAMAHVEPYLAIVGVGVVRAPVGELDAFEFSSIPEIIKGPNSAQAKAITPTSCMVMGHAEGYPKMCGSWLCAVGFRSY